MNGDGCGFFTDKKVIGNISYHDKRTLWSQELHEKPGNIVYYLLPGCKNSLTIRLNCSGRASIGRWPQPGRVTSVACGRAELRERPSERGRRRSRSPQMMSVGDVIEASSARRSLCCISRAVCHNTRKRGWATSRSISSG